MNSIEKCRENLQSVKEGALKRGEMETFMQLSECETWFRYFEALSKLGKLPDLIGGANAQEQA